MRLAQQTERHSDNKHGRYRQSNISQNASVLDTRNMQESEPRQLVLPTSCKNGRNASSADSRRQWRGGGSSAYQQLQLLPSG